MCYKKRSTREIKNILGSRNCNFKIFCERREHRILEKLKKKKKMASVESLENTLNVIFMDRRRKYCKLKNVKT
jgi:hypothetical protein